MSSASVVQVANSVIEKLNSRILGQSEVVQLVMLTVLCRGHALLTGAPGVAKTMLVRNLAAALGSEYKRIQFTPDLTPFDILGGDVIKFDKENPDIKHIEFAQGPIFSPFILADEINRASPRTQSALLEAMQERQVSLGGVTHKLPTPFYVFATQNPIESDGTFPLPDAQLDRFIFNIEVPYPSFDAEIRVATLDLMEEKMEPVEHAEILTRAWEEVQSVSISRELVEASVRMVKNTRPEESTLDAVKECVEFGASPRASQAMVLAAKAKALLDGRTSVALPDIQFVAEPILRHRIQLGYQSMTNGLDLHAVLNRVITETIL